MQKKVQFLGSSRNGLPVETFSVIDVKAPSVGETKPSQVIIDIVINKSILKIKSPVVSKEWDSLREHDVVFLITFDPQI